MSDRKILLIILLLNGNYFVLIEILEKFYIDKNLLTSN